VAGPAPRRPHAGRAWSVGWRVDSPAEQREQS
jgi:hypothetical protein